MGGWLARRLLFGATTVAIVLVLSFTAIHLAPGTPFMPHGDRPPLDAATVSRLEQQFGLDRPLTAQFASYVSALAHGELGESFNQRRPVRELLASAVPSTLLLAGCALTIDLVLGLVVGVFQATHARTRVDTLLTSVSLFFYSLPTFWLGLVLLLVCGEWLHWLPVGGSSDPALYDALSWGGRLFDRGRHLILPALTLGLVGAAATARFQRGATLDALQHDYVRTARSLGVSPARAVWRHALPNALLPYLTLLGLALPFLFTGAVVVETVFAWPGMGKLAADAIATRDYPVVAAVALVTSVAVVAGSLLADCCYALADPRTRLPARS
jgi:peptide/nickel transport system permease protein